VSAALILMVELFQRHMFSAERTSDQDDLIAESVWNAEFLLAE
jgi:hypothetical protein